jgi:uncharacterized protein with HEPN domain
MARDIAIILDEILEMIRGIEDTVASQSRQEIEAHFMVRLGVHRAIEIISEASRHLPQELLELAPDIPWRSIRGMGNVLRHEYHHIADDVIWDVIQHDLPPLKIAIQALRAEIDAP